MSRGAKRGFGPRTRPEWVSLFVALALLSGVVGTIIYLWVTDKDEPARFRVEIVAPAQQTNSFHLPIRVYNEGDRTAAQVTVVGTVGSGDQEETAETVFDFVPGNSSVTGVLIFKHDPSQAVVRVVSYQQP